MSRITCAARHATEPLRAGLFVLILGIAATATLEPRIGVALSLVPAGIAAVLWVLVDPAVRLAPAWLASAFVGAWLPPVATVAGFNLRAHQVFMGLVLAVLLLRPGVARYPTWAWQYAAPMLGLFATALIFTVNNSPDLGRALGHVLLLGMNLCHAWLLLLLIGEDQDLLRRCLQLVAWATIVALGWTVLVMMAAQAGVGAVQGMIFYDRLPLVGPAGIRTGDIARFIWGVVLGSYFGSLALICAGLLRSREWGSWLLFGTGGVAGTVGIVLGLARGPLVAFLGGVATYGLGLLVQGRLVRVATTAAGALGLLLAAYVAVDLIDSPRFPVRDAFVGRVVQLATPAQYSTGTAGERLRMWQLMLEDVRANPLVGSGFDTYRKYVPTNETVSESFPVEILHATGVIGFAAYAAFQLLAVWRAVRVILRHRLATPISHAVLTLLAAHTGLTLASATNPSGSGALYWLLFALLIAAAEIGLRTPAPKRERHLAPAVA